MNSNEEIMTNVPMCVVCGKPASGNPNSEGYSFCGEDCEDAYYEESVMDDDTP